jgi:hypothetical protein
MRLLVDLFAANEADRLIGRFIINFLLFGGKAAVDECWMGGL